jgi:DNA modification methylase
MSTSDGPGPLWRFDCVGALELFKSLSAGAVDVMISDPPYSDDTHGKVLPKTRNDGGKVREVIDFPPIDAAAVEAISLEVVRVVRSWIVVFGDFDSIALWRRFLTAAGAEWIREGVWWKTDAQPQTSGDRAGQGIELMGLAHAPRAKGSGRMQWNGGGAHFREMGPSREPSVERFHPTQKPEWLMASLVSKFSSPGHVVIDPFAGSGTTGVVCVRTGRKFMGAEINPSMHARAWSRIAATKYQPPLFAEKMGAQVDFLKGTK